MKSKFLKTLLFFITLFIPLYIAFIILWGEFAPYSIKGNLKALNNLNGSTYKRNEELKLIKDVDLLFVGSSRSDRGFDIRIFKKYGYNSFNLGSTGQTPIQTEFLLNKHLDRLNPKIIIMEVCPYILSMSGLESSIDILMNTDVDVEMLKLLMKTKSIMMVNAYIFKLYGKVVHKGLKENSGSETYVNGGFIQTNFKTNRYVNARPQFKVRIIEHHLRSLGRIAENLKKRNIKLILVQAPIAQIYYRSYSGNKDFDKKMSSYSTYINFNTFLRLDEKNDFYDALHMTQSGVTTFNENFIRLILEKK